MKSRVILFFMIIICFILQTTVLHLVSIGSITPNLLLILCVSMGLMRGRKSGMWTGFFCGLLIDLFYGSLFGFYALIYMYAGFFSGYAFRIYYDDDIKVPMLLTAIMDLLYNLAVYILQFLLRGRIGLFTYLYRIIIPEIVYTVFLTVIVYKIFYFINRRFMTPARKESESIWVLK
ncbi:MAG TPA: rod shape-determining protein MreD [Candidatus Blautia intestinipullorum]|nr:rod shape-determining protein MreD [Candidatus Blautia intestinipullorum]